MCRVFLGLWLVQGVASGQQDWPCHPPGTPQDPSTSQVPPLSTPVLGEPRIPLNLAHFAISTGKDLRTLLEEIPCMMLDPSSPGDPPDLRLGLQWIKAACHQHTAAGTAHTGPAVPQTRFPSSTTSANISQHHFPPRENAGEGWLAEKLETSCPEHQQC